ncbi:MAG: hypothetical protein HY749_02430 [Gammaproteobacteria bacterium]|nr:hypothetical protein [Gammaproteobacteria bacterium]MBI5615527.1 hypothetical protein [Gammaproteobacteria bacterium]
MISRLSLARTFQAAVLGGALLALAGCGVTKSVTKVFHDDAPAPAKPAPAEVPADSPLTPRELLTARLINARAEANAPAITVGKLIEFADRSLACDCAGTRFVKSWERLDGGYQLNTNASSVRPLRFMCARDAQALSCYLQDIDRGAAVTPLEQRFMSGSEFIQSMYERGLNCPRTEPCAEPPPR